MSDVTTCPFDDGLLLVGSLEALAGEPGQRHLFVVLTHRPQSVQHGWQQLLHTPSLQHLLLLLLNNQSNEPHFVSRFSSCFKPIWHAELPAIQKKYQLLQKVTLNHHFLNTFWDQKLQKPHSRWQNHHQMTKPQNNLRESIEQQRQFETKKFKKAQLSRP